MSKATKRQERLKAKMDERVYQARSLNMSFGTWTEFTTALFSAPSRQSRRFRRKG